MPTIAPRPTEAELEILRVLWQLGPSTVRDVHNALSQRGTGYTTTLKLLQIMDEKGLVTRDLKARPQRWRAREAQAATQRRLLGALIDKAFGGSAAALVQQALSLESLDDGQRAEIRRLLGTPEEP